MPDTRSKTKALTEEDTISRRRLNASTPATQRPDGRGHHLQKAFKRVNTSYSTAIGRLHHQDAILPGDVNHIPAGDCHATSARRLSRHQHHRSWRTMNSSLDC
ncbi:hypothetical protein QE152_g26300 [Popillia japonica]|uniref:Uncharacterized protein n=1 Tax=Popillia japonica TaxID=7064 RepID=A0AAW1JYV4_POPJA